MTVSTRTCGTSLTVAACKFTFHHYDPIYPWRRPILLSVFVLKRVTNGDGTRGAWAGCGREQGKNLS